VDKGDEEAMTKEKELKDKAINIKGKQYVLVADRVTYFNDNYPNGSITTMLVSKPGDETVIVRATVTPDEKNDDRYFTAYSQAVIGDGMINKTSALENAETSAVGRALGFMGIGVIESIASADELNKTAGSKGYSDRGPATRGATVKQIDFMRKVAQQVTGLEQADDLDEWIEEILTIPPHKVPIFKVSDAVDKLKEQKKPMPTTDLKAPPGGITDEDIAAVERGELDF
jgi:hypothetical protein